jgi:nucleotide-binding universal stress UspA family protein
VLSDGPDLEVRPEVYEGDLAEHLLDVAATARLLVVSRRRTGHVGSMALGGTAWRCIRAADCPVVVTPPTVHPVRRAG